MLLKKQAYILIGDDLTGKTSFQKWLIWYLCDDDFKRLDVNLVHRITHPDSARKLETLFTVNRSIQEKMNLYETVDNYFHNHFKDADVCILSSHAGGNCIAQIRDMIDHLHARYYDVSAVFFSNHLNPATAEISKLHWDGRTILQNPYNEQGWEKQIDHAAKRFCDMIIRTSFLY